jgi:hypothetical protein
MGLRGEKKHPRDERRRQNKTSQRKKQKIKQSYNGIKKDNYKKNKGNVVSSVECSICFNKVSNTYDNSVKCGKTTHFICGECKFRCNETGNDKCPMCRSHPIRNPIARDVMLPVIKGERLEKPTCPYIYRNLSPKERRICLQSGNLITPFHPNSNRIVRERRGDGRSGMSLYHRYKKRGDPPFGWRKWYLRGGDIVSIDGEDRLGRHWPRTAVNHDASVSYDTEDEIYDDDDERFSIWDIPVWTRVMDIPVWTRVVELINFRTFG